MTCHLIFLVEWQPVGLSHSRLSMFPSVSNHPVFIDTCVSFVYQLVSCSILPSHHLRGVLWGDGLDNSRVGWMGKLSVKTVSAIKEPGKYGDGDGLYLHVSPTGTKSWILRTRVKGETQRREIGLGGTGYVSLLDARDKARELRKVAKGGVNPIPARDKKTYTFAQAAREVHSGLAPTFRNPKHAALWLSSLEQHIFKKIGDRNITTLTRPDVIAALAPIWTKTPDTARRVKQRIAAVFAWAIGKGHYHHPQPVDDALMKALPNIERQVEHMAALPFRDVPALMEQLADREAMAAHCLRFLILTAARSGEARGALWSEIDLAHGIWEIPASRMKAKNPHRVPLSAETLDILRQVKGLDAVLVFPSPQREATGQGKELSVNAFRPLMDRMQRSGFTTHGFRSAFRDWSSESAKADRVLAEAALAHVVRGVEGAYARSDLLDRRRDLMDAWARFATGQTGQVIALVRA